MCSLNLNDDMVWNLPLRGGRGTSSHNLSSSLTLAMFAISTHLCTSSKFSSCSGLLAHPLSAHSAIERRPYPSQKLSPLPAMISVRPPTGAPPTPLTATGDTASSTSTRASIATSRSRGRSTRTCRRVGRDKVAKIFTLKTELLTSVEWKLDKLSGNKWKATNSLSISVNYITWHENDEAQISDDGWDS